ncbi:sensor histidine kinase [Dactylosporangium sp. NPDC048998]|uniref:sensor histidine kinase n=1 Tax=Dactylosporangium sp. NPDC048998 TaxID=3363976 RepID=UPI0037192CE1
MALLDRTVDAALGAGAVVLLGGTAVALAVSWGGAYWLPGLLCGAAVCAIAMLRRRAPLAAAGAGLVVAVGAVLGARVAGLPVEPQPGLALGLAALVAGAVRRLEPRVAGAVAGAALAVLAAGPVLSAQRSSGGATAAAVADVLAWVCGAGAGLWLRLQEQRRREMADAVRREERLALARELHDVVAHHVTGIVVQAQAARVVARRAPEHGRLDEAVAGIEAAGSEALTAMRRIVGLLRDNADAAPASGGTERLETLVRRFSEAPREGERGDGPREVRVELPDGADDWPPELNRTVYRVVQEALTNVARHAGRAELVTVRVTRDAGGVTVEVTDDGPPPGNRGGPGGFGLIGMRERVEALGGRLCAGPAEPRGWSVVARLPR